MKLSPDVRIQAAIASLAKARAEFEIAVEAGLVLGNDNHIGDIGEYWVRRFYEARGLYKCYADAKNARYDMELIDGTRVSVKTLTAWSKRGVGTQVKPLCGRYWQLLAAVLLDRDLQPDKIAIVPLAELKRRPVFVTNATNRDELDTRTFPRFQWWPWLDEFVQYPAEPLALASEVAPATAD